jgi:hypothetical protein
MRRFIAAVRCEKAAMNRRTPRVRTWQEVCLTKSKQAQFSAVAMVARIQRDCQNVGWPTIAFTSRLVSA